MNFMFSWQEQCLTSERIFLKTLEHKIHIFSPPCNILYRLHAIRYSKEKNKHDKERMIQQEYEEAAWRF